MNHEPTVPIHFDKSKQEAVPNDTDMFRSISLQHGFCVFRATLSFIVSLNDYKLVIITINMSNLLLADIVQQSEM